MLTILTTTNLISTLKQYIKFVDRLDELLTITTKTENHSQLIVSEKQILKPIDWFDLEPPYYIPPQHFNKENTLALIFFQLENYQKAFKFLSEGTPLFKHLHIAYSIKHGLNISSQQIEFSKSIIHNYSILKHYGVYKTTCTLHDLKLAYTKAIKQTTNSELKAFTIKHYSNLLIDNQDFETAETLIENTLLNKLSEAAKISLKTQLVIVKKQQLVVPFKQEDLDLILELSNFCISYFEKYQLKINAGLLLVEASEIANFKREYILAKNLINKAILYFKAENIPEFLGEASLQKAMLLYTWSKNGQPQYYKAAINAFQDTLKVFKRDTHPEKFAEIQHSMALIYSEIPVASEEKPMWTAFCASAFKEALMIYTKAKYPYEYAMVCHNYATALINFPKAKLHNNLTKSNGLFQEALAIRNGTFYPFERASTLLNQLELFWLLHHEDSDTNAHFNTMKLNIDEIKRLVNTPEILEKLAFHETQLQTLNTVL